MTKRPVAAIKPPRPKVEKPAPLPAEYLARMADARVTMLEVAEWNGRKVTHVEHRRKLLGLSFKGGEVMRERSFLAGGGFVIREPVGGVSRWTSASRSWEGDPMFSPYLDAVLEHGRLARVEGPETETYRLAGVEGEKRVGG